MRAATTALVLTGLLSTTVSARSSGALGIYGIVEKVVFEPNETAPTRLQVWGAFAFVEGLPGPGLTVSPAARGYLYFRLPTADDGETRVTRPDTIRREWTDLKAVAGTGRAVGFGSWGYFGDFADLRADVDSRSLRGYVIEASPGRPITDLRVRPATEKPTSPALYQTETGMVKLSETGSHADIVKRLKEALRR
jgi:hypothetical protein